MRRTSVHCAVLKHKVACVHKLLTLGCNPDTRDKVGNSACHYAAEDGSIDILDVLLKHDVDTNAQDITLKTPLMKASRNDRLDAVKRLVNAGCVVNMHDENCDTALHFAARRGSAALVQVLLTAGSQVDILNQWGHTPLMDAICYNNKGAATLILAAGCDVNLRASKSGDTVMHMAVRKNYGIFIKRLLATGRVHHIYNYQGELPIYNAVVNDKLDILKLFILYNLDLDVPAKLDYDGTGGKTVVEMTLERGHIEMVKLLSQLGYVTNLSRLPTEYQIMKILFSELSCVCTLKQLCRRTIRKQLGVGVIEKVQHIGLPRSLKEFVLLRDILS